MKYVDPDLKVIYFASEDIIATSSEDGGEDPMPD